MSTTEASSNLIRNLGRAYPTAVQRIVLDVACLSLPGTLRQKRDMLFVTFLKSRGVRDASTANFLKKVKERVNTSATVDHLISDHGQPTLQSLCEFWLLGASSDVAHIAAEFDVAERGLTLTPPPLDRIEKALQGLGGRSLEQRRAAMLALISTARLGAPRSAAAVSTEIKTPLVSPGGEPSEPVTDEVLVPPPTRQDPLPMTIKSTNLARILDQVHQLAADDGGWDELEVFITRVRERATWAAKQRQKLQQDARLRAILDRWERDYGEVATALSHTIPQLDAASLAERLATRWDEFMRDAVPKTDGNDVFTIEELEGLASELFRRYDAVRVLVANAPSGMAAQIAHAKKTNEAVEAASDAYRTLLDALHVPDAQQGTAPSASMPPEAVNVPPVVQPSVDTPSAPPQAEAEAPSASPPVPAAQPMPSAASPPTPINIPSPSELAALVTKDAAAKGVMMCLDFGTSRSKAMAVRDNGEPVLLDFKAAAGSDYVNSVASSVWFDAYDRRIFFGDEAIRRSLVQGQLKHRRIDSLKDFLSSPIGGDLPRPDGHLLEEVYDSTHSGFTTGEVLVLYLAYFIWAAEASLTAAKVVGDVPRRFATPSWPPAHREAGIRLLREYLARATLLARHVGPQWPKGLPIEEAKKLARAALDLPVHSLPMHLFAQGITEPLAAIGTRGDELAERRGLVLIVDVGAGTTDFGLFLVSVVDEHPRFVEVANHYIKRAGNHLDEYLREYLMEQLASDLGQDRTPVMLELMHRQRSIKEELLLQGRTTVRLQAGYTKTITREEFLAQPKVQEFGREVLQALRATLQRAESDVAAKGVSLDWDGRYSHVRVVLTGGGATLPMLKVLAPGTFIPRRNADYGGSSVEVSLSATEVLPEAAKFYRFDPAVYLPLAVAWGGAMPELPTQAKMVDLVTVPMSNPQRIAEAIAGPSEHWSTPKA